MEKELIEASIWLQKINASNNYRKLCVFTPEYLPIGRLEECSGLDNIEPVSIGDSISITNAVVSFDNRTIDPPYVDTYIIGLG